MTTTPDTMATLIAKNPHTCGNAECSAGVTALARLVTQAIARESPTDNNLSLAQVFDAIDCLALLHCRKMLAIAADSLEHI